MKSFLQGKKSLDAPALRLPPALMPAHAPRCEAKPPLTAITPGASSANVEVVKEGDKIARIVVTCVCGERVEIECLYSAGS